MDSQMANENGQVEGAPMADGEKPDRGREFKIQIDKDHFEVKTPTPTGFQLLSIAGKLPPEQFAIYLRTKGAQPKRIGLQDTVDLREAGVERFVTLPLDQTEG